MKLTRQLRLIYYVLAIITAIHMQHVQAQSLGGGIFSGSARRIWGFGASPLPATCATADVFVPNAPAVALNLCTAPNVWSALATTSGTVPVTRTISTTAPLGGGGDLSADRTLTCTTCATSANNLSFFSSTSSAQLATLLSDETGTNKVVFSDSPTIVTPTIASFTNATHNHQNAAGGGTLVDAAITFTTPALGAPTATTLQTSGNVGIGNAPSVVPGLLLSGTSTGNYSTIFQVTNADASDTGSAAQYKATADTAVLQLTAHGTGRTTSRFGSAIGGWDEIVTNGGSGLKLGSIAAVPVIIGTNSTAAITIDSSQNTTFAGQIIPSQTLGIVGTTTNNNANAGAFGEYQAGTVAANTTSLSTGTTANVGANTNITLTAGDWDCSGVVNFTFGATTSITNLAGGISTTTATLPAQDSYFDYETPAIVPTGTAVATWVVPTVRLSLSGSTNVFLVSQATFTVSTIKVGGTIRCRRMR